MLCYGTQVSQMQPSLIRGGGAGPCFYHENEIAQAEAFPGLEQPYVKVLDSQRDA